LSTAACVRRFTRTGSRAAVRNSILVGIMLRSSVKASRFEARSQKLGTWRLRHPFWGKSACQDAPGSTRTLRSISNPYPFSPSTAVIRSRRPLHFAGCEVDLVRRLIVEALMRPARVVEMEVIGECDSHLPRRLVSVPRLVPVAPVYPLSEPRAPLCMRGRRRVM